MSITHFSIQGARVPVGKTEAQHPTMIAKEERARLVDQNGDGIVDAVELQGSAPADRRALFELVKDELNSRWLFTSSTGHPTQNKVASALIALAGAVAGSTPVGAALGFGYYVAHRAFDLSEERRLRLLVGAANFVGASLEPPRAVAIQGGPGPQMPEGSEEAFHGPAGIYEFNASPNRAPFAPRPPRPERPSHRASR